MSETVAMIKGNLGLDDLQTDTELLVLSFDGTTDGTANRQQLGTGWESVYHRGSVSPFLAEPNKQAIPTQQEAQIDAFGRAVIAAHVSVVNGIAGLDVDLRRGSGAGFSPVVVGWAPPIGRNGDVGVVELAMPVDAFTDAASPTFGDFLEGRVFVTPSSATPITVAGQVVLVPHYKARGTGRGNQLSGPQYR